MSTLALLASILFLGLVAAAAIWLVPRCQRRQAHFRAMAAMEERYRGQLKHRDGLQYHADWARERGDREEALALNREIARVDQQLAEMQDEYDLLSASNAASLCPTGPAAAKHL